MVIGVLTFIYGAVCVGLQIPEITSFFEHRAVAIPYIVSFSVSGLFNILNLIFGPLLVFAALKEKPKLLFGWLIYMAIFLNVVHLRLLDFTRILSKVINLVLAGGHDILWYLKHYLILFCVDIAILFIFLYFMVIVYSFRKSLLLPRRDNQMEMDRAAGAKDGLLA